MLLILRKVRVISKRIFYVEPILGKETTKKSMKEEDKEGRMELKILGSTYQVYFVNSISREKLQIGETDYLNQRIKILTGLHAELEKVTLIHEILHVIFDQLEFDEGNNEHLVQSLATALYQVFNENKIL